MKEGGLKQAGREFIPAFKTSWPYSTIGLAVGLGLVLWAEIGFKAASIQPPQASRMLLPVILQHIGLGFVVSAITVFFYEWGAHHKKVTDLAYRLAQIQSQLTELVHSKGLDALKRALSNLLPEDQASIGSDLVRIVDSLSELQRKDIWALRGYVQCLSKIMRAVRNNIESLSSLDRPGDFGYSVSPATTADAILAVQMRELHEGDSYDVISYLGSWMHHRLDNLHEESRAALRRDVKVRRVFNLTERTSLSREEALKIMLAHAEEAAAEPNYQVRLLLSSHLEGGEVLLQERIQGAQLAVFRHRGEVLRVRILTRDLSELSMGSEGMPVDLDRKLFDQAWNAAAILTDDVARSSLEDSAFGYGSGT
jgi:hypothetical protein